MKARGFIWVATALSVATLVIYNGIKTYEFDVEYAISQQEIAFDSNAMLQFRRVKAERIAAEKARLIQELSIKKHIETPESVRAIYMSSWIASSKKLRTPLLDFIDESELNAIVLDIKENRGRVVFDLETPLVGQYGSVTRRVSDMEDFLLELRERNIYTIGRLTLFQDPLLAQKRPDLAFKRKDNGGVWEDRKGLAFIHPAKEEALDYYIEIARGSYDLGFDEINFDYIRFPSDGDISNIDYQLNGETRADIMKDVYVRLDKELKQESGIPISADLFGMTTEADDDLAIGQVLVDALPHFDAVAPMVYPSHYGAGYAGYANPAEYPYEVVERSMSKGVARAHSIGLDGSSLRTWIQDFDLGAPYGKEQVIDQIQASYDTGVYSYMVWDPKNVYTRSAYRKEFHPETVKEKKENYDNTEE